MNLPGRSWLFSNLLELRVLGCMYKHHDKQIRIYVHLLHQLTVKLKY